MIDHASLAEALERAGVDGLHPSARAYLTDRLVRHVSDTNLGGLRDTRFGARRDDIGGVAATNRFASFPDLGAAANALVSTAYRAAPRDWSRVDDAELTRLGDYPVSRPGSRAVGPADKIPVPRGDGDVEYVSPEEAVSRGAVQYTESSWDLGPLFSGLELGDASDWFKSAALTALGPAGTVVDVVSERPSSDAEASFRRLMADWEGYDRLGVGGRVLPGLRDDVVDWRKFRDDWLSGNIPGKDIAARLNVQVSASNKVRQLLKEGGVVDPAIASDPAKGVDVEESTAPLAVAASVNREAKDSPIIGWLTSPGGKTNLPVIGPVPDKVIWTVGIGVAAAIVLMVYSRKNVTKVVLEPAPVG